MRKKQNKKREQSRREWQEATWSHLMRALAHKPKQECEAILGSLFTHYERAMVVNRLVAYAMIQEGRTYKEISGRTWLSPTTINTLKKSMRNKTGYVSYRARPHIAKRYTLSLPPPPQPFWRELLEFVDALIKSGPRGMGIGNATDVREWRKRFE